MSEPITSLLLFALVATVSPGGATTLATASGAQFGYARSVPLMAGIAAALATLTGATAAGLSAVLLALPVLSVLMKLAGSAYLIWLAWKIGSMGAPQGNAQDGASPMGFATGYLLLLVNPKAWAMAFAASASFSAVASGPLQLALAMGTVFAGAALLSLSLWCGGGALLARTIRTQMQWRAVNMGLAALLAASIVPLWID